MGARPLRAGRRRWAAAITFAVAVLGAALALAACAAAAAPAAAAAAAPAPEPAPSLCYRTLSKLDFPSCSQLSPTYALHWAVRGDNITLGIDADTGGMWVAAWVPG